MAARELGMHPKTALALAKDHPRIAAAMARNEERPDGLPASKEARQADFLKALIDHNGVVRDALQAAGMTEGVLTAWRRNGQFKAAEKALKVWLAHRPAMPIRRRAHGRTTPGQYDRLLGFLEDPKVSIIEAARNAGLTRENVYYRLANDGEFAQQFRKLRPGRETA
ncbi:hypothetical protein ACGF0D_10815 [Kitasatospora sp. NPDC048298]|uniref:hypothetical protein n=1 Tax=Kitasatospora sp. NPDC048298 TaxID=3364049 RepID=UPI00372136EA